MEEQLETWIRQRRRTIKHLKTFARELEEIEKNVNIAKITGTVFSLAFGFGSVVAGFVSLFTVGAAAPVAVVLGIVATTGSVTTAGSCIVKRLIKKTGIEKAQQAIYKDIKETRNLHEMYKSKLKILLQEKEPTCTFHGLASKVVSGASGTNTLVSIISSFGLNLLQLSGNVGDDALNTAGRIFTSMSKVTKVASPIIGVLFIPLDIYTLVTTSISIHKHSPSKIAAKIRSHADKMQKELDKAEVKSQNYIV